jgi:hypothetical protein
MKMTVHANGIIDLDALLESKSISKEMQKIWDYVDGWRPPGLGVKLAVNCGVYSVICFVPGFKMAESDDWLSADSAVGYLTHRDNTPVILDMNIPGWEWRTYK